MATAPKGNEGALNGTTWVVIVPAPAANEQHTAKGISVDNQDTAAVTVTLAKNKGGTRRRLAKKTLDVGDTLEYDKAVVLDATDETVEAQLSGAAATSNPEFDAAYLVTS